MKNPEFIDNGPLSREVSREILLTDVRDIQECVATAQSIYETLRHKDQFIVGDTQISDGIPNKPSLMNTNMRFVLKDALIDEFTITNPRKGDESGITITAKTKDTPGRLFSFKEMRDMQGHELLHNAFFVNDSFAAHIRDPKLQIEPVALEEDVLPWLLMQEGYDFKTIKKIIKRESDPIRFTVDLLSKRADSVVNIEEIKADLSPDLVVGGQRIEMRDPKRPTSHPIYRKYAIWTTSTFSTSSYGDITERTIVRFSPDDPLMLYPDNLNTSIAVNLESAHPIPNEKLEHLALQTALQKADGQSVNLLHQLQRVLATAQRFTEAPL